MRSILRAFTSVAAAVALLIVLPATSFAQSSIAGVVKDDSGAVLPGVTVEAASPALIEKTRTVVSDAQGQFKIVDLRPGVYAVTFTLQGFSTFKRDGITLQASTVATVNGVMKVGALEETITVTGEAPLVDVQSSVQQQVVNRDLLDQLPSGRQMWNIGATLPGIVASGQDVGGASGIQQIRITAHGTDGFQTVTQVDGMELNTMGSNGSAVPYFNDGMAFKWGYQWGFGGYDQRREANADLIQVYRNGVPTSSSTSCTSRFSVRAAWQGTPDRRVDARPHRDQELQPGRSE